MQGHDWNDLKYLLALNRTGKLKHAGQILGASDTTVSRRIRALEQKLGTSLFLRSANGCYETTEAAQQILAHAENIERENLAIQERSGKSAQHVAGRVRISSVPIIVNRVLVPNLTSLARRHPDLVIDLVPASGNLDLSKREADLALRFARPKGGGLRIKAQKLGQLTFGAYGPSATTPEERAALGWITYDDAHSELPQARWLDTVLANTSEPAACLTVADAETAMEAAASGLGKTILPRTIAEADPRLSAFLPSSEAKYPVREVWLLAHCDQTTRPSVIAAKEWLTELLWD